MFNTLQKQPWDCLFSVIAEVKAAEVYHSDKVTTMVVFSKRVQEAKLKLKETISSSRLLASYS